MPVKNRACGQGTRGPQFRLADAKPKSRPPCWPGRRGAVAVEKRPLPTSDRLLELCAEGQPSRLFAAHEGVPSMCDYSLLHVASRPAKIQDKLVTFKFHSITRGFAAVGEPNVAVCLLPGTEVAFERDVECEPSFGIGSFRRRRSATGWRASARSIWTADDASRCAGIPRRKGRAGDAAVRGPDRDSAAIAGRVRASARRRWSRVPSPKPDHGSLLTAPAVCQPWKRRATGCRWLFFLAGILLWRMRPCRSLRRRRRAPLHGKRPASRTCSRRLAFPQMPHAMSLQVFRPFRHEDRFAALGAGIGSCSDRIFGGSWF